MLNRFKDVKDLLQSNFTEERKKRYILHTRNGRCSADNQPRTSCDFFYDVFVKKPNQPKNKNKTTKNELFTLTKLLTVVYFNKRFCFL